MTDFDVSGTLECIRTPEKKPRSLTDVLNKAQRSLCMARNRPKDTSPEIRLRRALWGLGLRYRLDSTLPGKPDLAFSGKKTAIFVDGCFWHRCPQHFKPPETNVTFWRRKLSANVARDKRINKQLQALGWQVIRVWEHEVDASPDRAARKIQKRMQRMDG